MKQLEAIPHDTEMDTFHFQASLSAIKRAITAHKLLVFITVLLTTSMVVAYIKIWPPVFQSEVMIAVSSDNDMHRNAFYQQWNVFRKDDLADEATLMVSGPVLLKVIEQLDLSYDEVYHPFMSYVVHLWGESWVGQTYRKIKYSIFPAPKSPFSPSEKDLERYKVLKDFRGGVSVQQVGESNIGLLVVRASSQRVAEIANTLVDVYLEERRNRFVFEAKGAYQSLYQETEKALVALHLVEERMKEFYSDNNLLLLFEKDRVQLSQWLGLRAAITNLEAEIAQYEHSLKIIERQMISEGREIVSGRIFQDNAIKSRLTQLELALADARQKFQPGAPEVRDLEEQIRMAMSVIDEGQEDAVVRNTQLIGEAYELLRSKKRAIESELAGARASLQIKQVEADRIKIVLDSIPEKMQANHELERQQLLLESKYQSLNEKLNMAAVSMATARSAPSAMRVVEYAAAPEKPVSPKTKLLILVAIVLGTLLGVIGALVLELVFLRVNRFRLWNKGDEYDVFAIVNQDKLFLKQMFPRMSSNS